MYITYRYNIKTLTTWKIRNFFKIAFQSKNNTGHLISCVEVIRNIVLKKYKYLIMQCHAAENRTSYVSVEHSRQTCDMFSPGFTQINVLPIINFIVVLMLLWLISHLHWMEFTLLMFEVGHFNVYSFTDYPFKDVYLQFFKERSIHSLITCMWHTCFYAACINVNIF